jgi:hypothetical protein
MNYISVKKGVSSALKQAQYEYSGLYRTNFFINSVEVACQKNSIFMIFTPLLHKKLQDMQAEILHFPWNLPAHQLSLNLGKVILKTVWADSTEILPLLYDANKKYNYRKVTFK